MFPSGLGEWLFIKGWVDLGGGGIKDFLHLKKDIVQVYFSAWKWGVEVFSAVLDTLIFQKMLFPI